MSRWNVHHVTIAHALVLPGSLPDNPADSRSRPIMSLLVLGLNHRTAPIEVRERIVFDAERLPRALASLRRAAGHRRRR